MLPIILPPVPRKTRPRFYGLRGRRVARYTASFVFNAPPSRARTNNNNTITLPGRIILYARPFLYYQRIRSRSRFTNGRHNARVDTVVAPFIIAYYARLSFPVYNIRTSVVFRRFGRDARLPARTYYRPRRPVSDICFLIRVSNNT